MLSLSFKTNLIISVTMPELSRDKIEDAIKQIKDPNAGKPLGQLKAVKDIAVEGGRVQVAIRLGYPAASWLPQLKQQITDAVSALDVDTVGVDVSTAIESHSVQKTLKPMEKIKNVIAVASGKGGVGKSTTAVNLALAIAAEGASVGLLDADIYGPSQPSMLGIKGQPDSQDGQTLEPMEQFGIQAMSIGFLIDEETPMIWRGPMVTQALEQLLNNTNWHEMDYLIVDLPPGTGDVQLTLAQKIPVSGAVIVTTPQDIALLDARKGINMFKKVDVPILGVVENMSTHICSKCGHEEHIFGSGGGEKMAADFDVRLLASLPLDVAIREQTDSGNPTVVAEPEGSLAKTYKELARCTTAQLATQGKDYSAKFPKIVVSSGS